MNLKAYESRKFFTNFEYNMFICVPETWQEGGVATRVMPPSLVYQQSSVDNNSFMGFQCFIFLFFGPAELIRANS